MRLNEKWRFIWDFGEGLERGRIREGREEDVWGGEILGLGVVYLGDVIWRLEVLVITEDREDLDWIGLVKELAMWCFVFECELGLREI